jgi:hypothetical protein
MSTPPLPPELHKISESFRWNAANVLRGASPLYERLAHRIADDAAILALAARLILTTPQDGALQQETLAICDDHGRWLEWIYEDAAV